MTQTEYTDWYSENHIKNGEPQTRIDELIYKLHTENKMKVMMEESIKQRDSLIKEEIRKRTL